MADSINRMVFMFKRTLIFVVFGFLALGSRAQLAAAPPAIALQSTTTNAAASAVDSVTAQQQMEANRQARHKELESNNVQLRTQYEATKAAEQKNKQVNAGDDAPS